MGLDIYHFKLIKDKEEINRLENQRLKDEELPKETDYGFLDKTENQLKQASDLGEVLPGVVERFYDFVKNGNAFIETYDEINDYQTTFRLLGYGDYEDYEISAIGLLRKVKDYSGKIHEIKGVEFYKLSEEYKSIKKLLDDRVKWKKGEGYTDDRDWIKKNFKSKAKKMLKEMDWKKRKIQEISIEFNHIITKKETALVYFRKEVGYERKGMKDSFYKNYPMYHIILNKNEAEDLICNFAMDGDIMKDHLNIRLWEDGVSYIKLDW